MTQITDPALKWPGSKWQMMPKLRELFPPHRTYVSAFGDSAADILRKFPAEREIYNDINGHACNFFDVLREDLQAFIKAIKSSPYCEKDFKRAAATLEYGGSVERARKFYVTNWQGMSYGGPGASWRLLPYNGEQGGGKQKGGHNPVRLFNRLRHLIAIRDRLKQVQIADARPYEQLIDRCDYEDCLWFLDPPYAPEVVKSNPEKLYLHGKFDHLTFLVRVRKLKGMAIVCGYDWDLYNEILWGWTRREFKVRDRARNSRTEVVWLNPAAVERLEKTRPAVLEQNVQQELFA